MTIRDPVEAIQLECPTLAHPHSMMVSSLCV